MNLGLTVGIVSVIIIIIIAIIIVVILKHKNNESTNNESESSNKETENQKSTNQKSTNKESAKSESETKLTSKSESESTNASNQEIKTSSNSNSDSIKPEEIVSQDINAPKELSQAELKRAEIMKEILQDQQTDFDKTLENELNINNYITDKINDYFNCELSNESNLKNEKYILITRDNIIPFKFIIPAYNPTNGGHFIYSITYWILRDKFDEFHKSLLEVLEDIKLNNDVIEDSYSTDSADDFNAGYILFKTYTNTSTPSYQYERINGNLKKKFDTIYFVNKSDISKIELQKADETLCINIYTYQGNVNEFAKKLDTDYKLSKIKKVVVKPFNVEAYGLAENTK
jgi:hypothetical protein